MPRCRHTSAPEGTPTIGKMAREIGIFHFQARILKIDVLRLEKIAAGGMSTSKLDLPTWEGTRAALR
jgi:hypothetical protein